MEEEEDAMGAYLVWYSLNGLTQYYCNIPSVDQAEEQ